MDDINACNERWTKTNWIGNELKVKLIINAQNYHVHTI